MKFKILLSLIIELLLNGSCCSGYNLKLTPQLTYRNTLNQVISSEYVQKSLRSRSILQLNSSNYAPVSLPSNFTYNTPQIVFVDVGYAVNVGFGTPPQQIPLTIDTGSPATFVKSTLCVPCDQFCVNSSKGLIYDPSNSTSSTVYSGYGLLTYGDGTMVAGFRTNDTIRISGNVVESGQFIAASGTTDGAESGIMGLSRPQTRQDAVTLNEVSDGHSLPQPIWYQNFQQNSDALGMFSLYFDSNYSYGASGELLFGSIDPSRFIEPLQFMDVVYDKREYIDWSVQLKGIDVGGQQQLKNCSGNSCFAFIDSGTSTLLLPTGIANKILNSYASSSKNGCTKFGHTFHQKFLKHNSFDEICETVKHSDTLGDEQWVERYCNFEYEGAPVCPSKEKQRRTRSLLQGDCPSQSQINDQHTAQQQSFKYMVRSQNQSTNQFKKIGLKQKAQRQSPNNLGCDLCKTLGKGILEEYKNNLCHNRIRKIKSRELLFKRLRTKIDNTCQQSQLSNQGAASSFPCSNMMKGPNLTFYLGNLTVVMEPQSYVQQLPDSPFCTVLVTPQDFSDTSVGRNAAIILGLPFLKKFYTVFDNDNSKIAIAVTKSYQQVVDPNVAIPQLSKVNLPLPPDYMQVYSPFTPPTSVPAPTYTPSAPTLGKPVNNPVPSYESNDFPPQAALSGAPQQLQQSNQPSSQGVQSRRRSNGHATLGVEQWVYMGLILIILCTLQHNL